MLDKVIDLARERYVEAAENHARHERLTDRTLLKEMRAFRDGDRKSLTPEMRVRLVEHAAFSGRLPRDLDLRHAARDVAQTWNEGNPFGAHFRLSGDPLSTLALVHSYLGEIGTHRGHKPRSRGASFSSWALDAAVGTLRAHCPHAWQIATHGNVSAAERWLFEKLQLVEPGITRDVVRATIQRNNGLV